MNKKMSDKDKEAIRKYKKPRCFVCDTTSKYTNPIATCADCKKKFCYDHIWSVLLKNGVKDFCDCCVGTHKP